MIGHEMTTVDPRKIDEFWAWFVEVSDSLIAGIERPGLMSRLDDLVRGLHPGLIWEISVGMKTIRQLTISPNFNRDLLPVARRILFNAPVLPHWEFYATRTPKEWNYKVLLKSHAERPVELDVNDWVFILLSAPDGGWHVLLSGKNLPLLTDSQRRQAAGDVLCNILGEQLVMDVITEFELVHRFHHYLAHRATSIRFLPVAIANVQRCKSCGEEHELTDDSIMFRLNSDGTEEGEI
ncbi:MAG TPA: hypothetical protein VFK06_17930 [Candidatus Angelobacter sp.]|nr:hypothetical protein [Candidatus Angelobacter sp.]